MKQFSYHSEISFQFGKSMAIRRLLSNHFFLKESMADTKFRERVSTVVVKNDKILGFNAIDPNNGKHYVFLPGGGIEENESLSEAATRETREETGYEIKIIGDPLTTDYFFQWNGTQFACRTHFFRGEIVSKLDTQLNEPDYHKGICWIDINTIEENFSYSREILAAIKSLL